MANKQNRLVVVDEGDVELDGSDTSSEDTEITTPFDPSKIRVETKNTQMDALIKRIQNHEIDLSPDFQRQAGVWNAVTQSRLIESMLIRIPLPAFYMDATDDDRWIVVDGLQRLTTIRRFVVDKTMNLEGMEFLTDYNGLDFDGLPRTLQRRIEETDIVVYLIQPGTPDRVKFDIFRRINTGGLPLSPQEIRHALNQGRITQVLKELAESELFIQATDNGVSAKRMDDRECVLRCLAFSHTSAGVYDSNNFDMFLNGEMAMFNEMSDKELSKYTSRFERAMERAFLIFGRNAFRKQYSPQSYRYPINKALFESWAVNLGSLDDSDAKSLISKRDELLMNFMGLMRDYDFETAISQGTGSPKRVRLRFSRIRSIISETL